MIRKVICPTDLSPAAQNAVAYAAKLCQLAEAPLELVYVEPVFDMVFAGGSNIAAVSGELKKTCYEVNRLFGISCSYDIETSGLPVDEAIGQKSNEETLIVAGTNGADSVYQRIFGPNAFNIAKQAFSHVLVVPEGVSFGTIRTIAFAWDYEITKPFLHRLHKFSGQLSSRLVFLHVSTHATTISEDVFNALRERITEAMGEKSDVTCRRLYAARIREGLDQFMKEKQADLLAISMKNGRLVRKAFRNSQAESLPSYPLLIVHSRKSSEPFS